MSMKYGTGKDKLVGQSIIYSFPISLDAAQYEGAVIVASDGQLYFSDGADWKIPNEEVDIARPSALIPTNAIEQTQLRLSNFRSPGGFTQTGIFFEVSYTNNFATPDFTRVVTSTTASMYQTLYPEDGIQPGDVFWWRAKYLGNDGTQSEFSLPFEQTYPELIDDPVPVTREGATTGFLQLSPYVSAFGLNYVSTEVEIYQSDGVTLVTAFTSLVGASVPVPETVTEGQPYVWRARYNGRTGTTGPVLATEWTPKQSFFNGAKSMVLVYDPALAVARTITLPLFGTVNVVVDWGDGTTNTYTTTGLKTKTYAPGVTGLVTVTISGSLTQYGFGNAGVVSQPGLIRVDNIGFGLGLVSMFGAFRNTTANFTYLNPAMPPQVINCSYLFHASTATALNYSTLTMSSVQDFTFMFASTALNPSIGAWDTSSAINMSFMFASNTAFNQNIGAWNVSNVTDFSYMFWRSSVFNNGGSPSINNWNTSSAVNMSTMLSREGVGTRLPFNQPVGNWNVSNVTNMSDMFNNSDYNQPLDDWDVSKVTNMRGMLALSAYNQPLNSWDVSSVTNMSSMFAGNTTFNRPLSNWNVASVTAMNSMFSNASTFNQPLDSWNVSNVNNMSGMFINALTFNQPLNSWNVGAVTNMGSMFDNARAFNQSLNSWNMSNVTTLANMFATANAFNSPISNWNVSNVSNMVAVFNNAIAFNQPIGNWNVSNVTDMRFMLQNAPFNQDISTWNLNNNSVNLGSFGLAFMSAENYSRMLVGWANRLALDDGPYVLTMNNSARQYNSTVYAAGSRFTNAVDARAFLVGTRVVSVTGSSDTNANTTYTYNGTTLTYDASNGWKFAILGTSWGLYNASAVLQATGTGAAPGTGPHTATSWTGVLSAATVLRTGAGWTITGDAAV